MAEITPAPLNLPEFQVEWVKTSSLKGYERNARKHSPPQIAQIQKSIEQYGWTAPLIVGRDNVIIAGHGRLLAAQNLGIARVPIVRADHLSAAQMRAYVIADNKLTENGAWDWDILRDELKALESMEFDTDLTGFSFQELTALQGGDPHHESYLASFAEAALEESAAKTEAREAARAAGTAETPSTDDEEVELKCPHCGGMISVR